MSAVHHETKISKTNTSPPKNVNKDEKKGNLVCSYCKKRFIQKTRYHHHLLTCKIRAQQEFIVQSRLEELKHELQQALIGNEENIQLQTAIEVIHDKIDQFSQESSEVFTESSESLQKVLEQKNLEIFLLKEKLEDKIQENQELQDLLDAGENDDNYSGQKVDENDPDDHTVVDLVIKTGEAQFNIAENFQLLTKIEKEKGFGLTARKKIFEMIEQFKIITKCISSQKEPNETKEVIQSFESLHAKNLIQLFNITLKIIESERDLIIYDQQMDQALNHTNEVNATTILITEEATRKAEENDYLEEYEAIYEVRPK